MIEKSHAMFTAVPFEYNGMSPEVIRPQPNEISDSDLDIPVVGKKKINTKKMWTIAAMQEPIPSTGTACVTPSVAVEYTVETTHANPVNLQICRIF